MASEYSLVKCKDCPNNGSRGCAERRKGWSPLCEGCAVEVEACDE